MIKARGTDASGKEVLLLGLSYRNLRRMRDGEVIAFDGTPYGFPGIIHIYAGVTEQVMAYHLQKENPRMRVIEEPNAT